MKKLSAVLLLLMLSLCMSAQNVYQTKALGCVEFCYAACIDPGVIEQWYVEAALDAGEPEPRARRNFRLFYSERIRPLLSDSASSVFSRTMKEEEMNRLNATMEGTAGNTVLQHTKAMFSNDNMQALMRLLAPAAEAIQAGKAAKPLKVMVGNSKSKKIQAYAALCDTKAICEAFTMMMSRGLLPDDMEAKMKNYIAANRTQLFVAIASTCYTEPDLDFLIRLYSSPSGKKCMRSATKVVNTFSKVSAATLIPEFLERSY